MDLSAVVQVKMAAKLLTLTGLITEHAVSLLHNINVIFYIL